VVVVESLEDILSRFRNKIASNVEQVGPPARQVSRSGLLPDRHPVRDFFIADVLDWALKDDRHSMEHPMFALSKIPDIKERRYEHNGNSISITPSIKGLATIWDKDILIYAVSQLVAAMNAGRQDLSPIIRLTAYDLLVSTNRHTGGGDYDQLQKAFERLAGTRITTDIRTNGVRQREGFGLIDAWKIIEKHPVNGRMVAIELRLSDWLYNAILGREVLTLSRDYFRLFGGLERRLYELARKHCGHQARWSIGVDLLHKKTGSTATLRKFRELLKRTAETDALPDYRIRYDPESEQVVFYTKNAQMLAQHIVDTSGY
jgi:plasmid replication initiation protein